ncbi:hypothetical protein BP00DRAFT_446207 [Aspergillus indologenus CBS 114.80]|uniref:Uncharacterized protein n=1 Tax=Aspergillus indologenus CBS 114.80 TaxID=1450541 RepID=A0A2V5IT38_9EURO|nr:hypothetical protein BP00DRAFT_446207 [Aspergillus indologenus CBS 114.80]
MNPIKTPQYTPYSPYHPIPRTTHPPQTPYRLAPWLHYQLPKAASAAEPNYLIRWRPATASDRPRPPPGPAHYLIRRLSNQIGAVARRVIRVQQRLRLGLDLGGASAV